jgi:hypothetical protein
MPGYMRPILTGRCDVWHMDIISIAGVTRSATGGPPHKQIGTDDVDRCLVPGFRDARTRKFPE